MILLTPVNCSAPAVPGNGSIMAYQNTTEGAEVLFKCNQGFMPEENMTAVCAVNGSWTPDPGSLVCKCKSSYSMETIPIVLLNIMYLALGKILAIAT